MKTIKDYIKFLEAYPIRQLPKAGQFIVNQLAYESRQTAIKEVDRRMILRNSFVTGRIQFGMARFSTRLEDIQAKMGALESIDFMAKQEKGFVIKSSKGKNVAIPTRGARVSKSIAKRKRTIYRNKRLGNINKINQYPGKNKKQKMVAMLQHMAKNKSKKPALVPFNRNPGIYVLRNIRKRGKKNYYTYKVIQLYDVSRKQVIVKPHPWLQPTNRKVSRHYPKIINNAWQRYLSKIR